VKRGDIITVALSGDYGKPRPAVIIQSDRLAETDSILICLITSDIREAAFHRLTVPAHASTGLRKDSQIMVEKIVAARKDRCSQPIGALDPTTLMALGELLAFVTGITEQIVALKR